LRNSVEAASESQLGNSTSLYGAWSELLWTLHAQSKNVPQLLLVEQNSQGADIKVFLEAEAHPEGKPGSAKIGRDKATFEVLFAEVHIYEAYDLYTQGYVRSVFEHELGHAIGLGHAGLESSIMHSPMLIVNGTAYAGIRNCEFVGTSSLLIVG
jgi:predicted Zn-dependent protease